MPRGAIRSQKKAVIREEVQPPETNIFDYLRVVCKYHRMICVVCSLAVVVTGIVCLLSPVTYVATASIVPPLELLQGDAGLGGGLLGGGEAALLRRVMDVTSIADIYVGILESRAVTDHIIDRFDLTNVYGADASRYEARQELRKNTTINVSDEGILSVAVEDADRTRAAAVANAYVEELDQQNKRLSAGQATSKRIFLDSRLREVEEKLSRIDNILSREAKVQEMLYELLVRECEIAKIEEAKSMPTIQVLDPAVPPERRQPRGTIRKAILAGVVSLVFGIFLAFGRECFAQYSSSEGGSSSFVVPPGSAEQTLLNESEMGQSPTPVQEAQAHAGHPNVAAEAARLR